MKKTVSIIMAALFMICAFSGMENISMAHDADITVVKHFIDVEVGKKVDALFVCDTNADDVKLDTGKKKIPMCDNGTKGDVKKDDNTYSVKMTLSSDERKTEKYSVVADGNVIHEYEVNYYKEFTQEDNARVQEVYDGINSIEDEMEKEGRSDDEIFSAVLDYISSCDCIESYENNENRSIAYTTDAGIASLYGRFSGDTKGAGGELSDITMYTAGNAYEVKGNVELQSWTNPNVLLVRPFRTVAGEDGFHNDRYIEMANKITAYTGGYVTVLDDSQTIPHNLLETFWQNGFIMVDSHGLDGYGNSYMYVWDGDGYTAGDVSAHRVMKANDPDHVYITGTYFQYYYDQMQRSLENTFLYFGICYGMKFESLRKPLFDMGAVCAFGYDNSVSMYFEAENVTALITHMTTINTQDETRTYNLKETYDYAIEKNGYTDPYGPGAHQQIDGDTTYVIFKPDVAVTGVTMKETEINSVSGQNCYIQPIITPAKVYGYKQEWTSSDSDVLEIIGTRMGKAKNPGTATVTVKITYDGKEYTASCNVHVTAKQAESIKFSVEGQGGRLRVGQTRATTTVVYPLDATDREVAFVSNNPGTATINDSGVITAVRPGKFTVKVYCKSNENISSSLSLEVVKDTVYLATTQFDDSHNFVIVGSGNAMTSQQKGEYMGYGAVSKSNGYYGGNITAKTLWKFVKTNGGWYLYNEDMNAYLTQGNEGIPSMSETPKSIFNMEGQKLYVVNPETDTTNVYLRFRGSKGFCFAKKTSGTNLEFGLEQNFADTDNFKVISFSENGTVTSTQCVEKGTDAVRAYPEKADGKTFIGWDACLANVTEDFTTNAVYEDGENDNIIVTFRDYDGTTISRSETKQGEKVTVPEAPVHDGMTFIRWSENTDNITENMIVFAVYGTGVPGDANGDGTVNTGDATVVLKFAANMISENDFVISNADMTSDGVVNTGDAVAILKYAAAN